MKGEASRSGDLAQEIKDLASFVSAREQGADSDLMRKHYANLGEVLMIAVGMAEFAERPDGRQTPMSDAVADALFENILYREFPDGQGSD